MPRHSDWCLSAFSTCLLAAVLVWASISSALGSEWHIERVDWGRSYEALTDRFMRLDAAGSPCFAYGKYELYYTWFDGVGWHHEIAAEGSTVGSFASLTLDPEDRPHLAAYDSGNEDLWYATKDASGWYAEPVDTAGAVGMHTSVDVDADEQPHITYYDETNRDLKYAHYDGSEWQLETVDSMGDVGRYTSAAVDGEGRVQVSYYSATDGRLKYARREEGGWQVEVVDSLGDVGEYSSLALDGEGWPHISYYDWAPRDLKYARKDSAGWHVETVDDAGDVGLHTSIGIDPNGYPHISYHGSYWPEMKYARKDAAGWHVALFEFGTNSSLAVDDSGHAHVGYRCVSMEMGYRGIRHTYTDGSGWYFADVVDDTGPDGMNSLALDAAGTPYVSYSSRLLEKVKFARMTESGWQLQDVADFGDAGLYGCPTSIALDGDARPHISYCYQHPYFPEDRRLKYAHHDGQTWQVEHADDSDVMAGWGNSIAVDSAGRPHISYNTMVGLRYARRDTTGWHIEAADSGPSWIGIYTSIALDTAGWPRIGYFTDFTNDLMYASRDSAGWHVQAVDTARSVGWYVSLALDAAGCPHISYYDEANKDLKYACLDSSGWRLVTVDEDGDVGSYTSVALDASGRPHISYAGCNCLKHAQWDGSDWQVAIVDSGSGVGAFTSLALDPDGCPHISYYDSHSGMLKHAYRALHDADEGMPGSSHPITARILSLCPNPVIGGARIRYHVSPADAGSARRVSLGIYDCAGRRVVLVEERAVRSGASTVSWHAQPEDGERVPPGVYFLRLEADNPPASDVRRVVVVR